MPVDVRRAYVYASGVTVQVPDAQRKPSVLAGSQMEFCFQGLGVRNLNFVGPPGNCIEKIRIYFVLVLFRK